MTELEKEKIVHDWLFCRMWNGLDFYYKRTQNKINYIVWRLSTWRNQ